MTTKTITKNQRTAEIVEGEIAGLEKLITRRNCWLYDDANKKLSTYDAVKQDTVQMAFTLEELKDELSEIETN